MASKRPIVRQVAWLSLLPQLALMVCIIVFARFIGFQNYVMAGAIIYLAISFLLRFGVPFHHRKGIALFKKGSFKEAIPFFEKSYAHATRCIAFWEIGFIIKQSLNKVTQQTTSTH